MIHPGSSIMHGSLSMNEAKDMMCHVHRGRGHVSVRAEDTFFYPGKSRTNTRFDGVVRMTFNCSRIS